MVLGVVLLLVGAMVFYFGVRDMRRMRALRSQGRQAFGRVTRHETRAGGSRSIVVAYTDDYGVTHELTSSFSSSSPIGIGETVTVRYLPGDPASATLDEQRENVRSAVLVIVLGLAFTAAGVTLAVRND